MKKDPRWDLTLSTLQNCESLLGELMSLPAVFQATLQVITCLEGLEDGIDIEEGLPKVADQRAVLVESQRSAEVVIRQTEALVELVSEPYRQLYVMADPSSSVTRWTSRTNAMHLK